MFMFYSFCVRGQCLVRRVINHVSVFVDFLREGETICSHSPLKVDTGGSDDLTDHPPASTKRGSLGLKNRLRNACRGKSFSPSTDYNSPYGRRHEFNSDGNQQRKKKELNHHRDEVKLMDSGNVCSAVAEREKPITSDTILSTILYKPETSDYSSVLAQYDFIASSINYKVDPETNVLSVTQEKALESISDQLVGCINTAFQRGSLLLQSEIKEREEKLKQINDKSKGYLQLPVNEEIRKYQYERDSQLDRIHAEIGKVEETVRAKYVQQLQDIEKELKDYQILYHEKAEAKEAELQLLLKNDSLENSSRIRSQVLERFHNKMVQRENEIIQKRTDIEEMIEKEVEKSVRQYREHEKEIHKQYETSVQKIKKEIREKRNEYKQYKAEVRKEMSKKHHQVMNAINELVYECLTKIKESFRTYESVQCEKDMKIIEIVLNKDIFYQLKYSMIDYLNTYVILRSNEERTVIDGVENELNLFTSYLEEVIQMTINEYKRENNIRVESPFEMSSLSYSMSYSSYTPTQSSLYDTVNSSLSYSSLFSTTTTSETPRQETSSSVPKRKSFKGLRSFFRKNKNVSMKEDQEQKNQSEKEGVQFSSASLSTQSLESPFSMPKWKMTGVAQGSSTYLDQLISDRYDHQLGKRLIDNSYSLQKEILSRALLELKNESIGFHSEITVARERARNELIDAINDHTKKDPLLEREDQLHSCLSQIIYDYKKEISSTAMKELEMEYKNTIYDILDFSNKLTDYFSNSIIQRYKFIFSLYLLNQGKVKHLYSVLYQCNTVLFDNDFKRCFTKPTDRVDTHEMGVNSDNQLTSSSSISSVSKSKTNEMRGLNGFDPQFSANNPIQNHVLLQSKNSVDERSLLKNGENQEGNSSSIAQQSNQTPDSQTGDPVQFLSTVISSISGSFDASS